MIWRAPRLPRVSTLIAIGIVVSIVIFLVSYVIIGATQFGAILSMLAFIISLYIDTRLDINAILLELKSRKVAEGIANEFVREVALAEVARRDMIFDDIARNRIHFDSVGSMMHVYYELLNKPDLKKMRATSMVSVNQLWESEHGKKALEENLKAVKRGVSIERIFIFPDEEAGEAPEAKAHLKKHADGGVVVRTVLSRLLDPGNRRDFGVADDSIVLQYSLGPDGDIVMCMLSANDRDVDQYDHIYDLIREASTEFKP
jgi:hypothetical protein